MIDRGAEILHALPGRVRLRVAGLKRDPALAREIEGRLSADPAIRRVEASLVTGSVLILFDPAAGPPGEFVRRLVPAHVAAEWEVPTLPTPAAAAHGVPPARGIAEFFRQLNHRVAARTGGLDLPVLLPLALLALGVRGLLGTDRKKLPVPTWYDLLWFAFGTFLMLNRTVLDADPGPRFAAVDPTADGQ
ncbi:MAG TPA: hypothetical protein VF590_24115 [Isosphaeraceae bacterium]|jgi:hypothetical protein